MKEHEHARDELLNDLFQVDPVAEQVGTEKVWRGIREAKRARARVRAGVAGAAVLAVAAWMTFRGAHSHFSKPVEKAAAGVATSRASVAVEREVPKIEHVNDDRLLELIEDAPAALVQWPDGRRSLLVVVEPPAPRHRTVADPRIRRR